MGEYGVEIVRDAPVALHPFTEFFKGFESVDAVKELFGSKTSQVLSKLKVEFFSSPFGYMSVSEDDGHLLISTHHLKNSPTEVLYLDVVHELFHVKQFLDGEKLFRNEFEYVDNPVEVAAYKFTVKEARRIGMKTKDIVEYLKVDWVDEEQHARLVKTLGL